MNLIEVTDLHVRMIFQDAVGSLNPRMTVRQTLEEVLKFRGLEVSTSKHPNI